MKLNTFASFACGILTGAAGCLLLKRYFKKREDSVQCLLFSPENIHPLNLNEHCGAMACSLCNLDKLCRLLKKTKFQLDVCVYLISEPLLTRIVAKLPRRGVRVRIIVDKQMSQDAFRSKVGLFIKHNIPIKYLRINGMMHNKFAIIDREIVITGSANWTQHGFLSNNENLVIVRNTEVAEAYLKYFNNIWTEERIVRLSQPHS